MCVLTHSVIPRIGCVSSAPGMFFVEPNARPAVATRTSRQARTHNYGKTWDDSCSTYKVKIAKDKDREGVINMEKAKMSGQRKLISLHRISPHLISSHLIASHLTSSHLITSHLIASHHISSHHITSHHITSHHITSHLITSHLITSHHITSHHITSHHLTSHHITSPGQ